MPHRFEGSRFSGGQFVAQGATMMSDARQVLEQAIERWNVADRDGWAELYHDDVVFEAPGLRRSRVWRTSRCSTSTRS
jgi:hypothetical protein